MSRNLETRIIDLEKAIAKKIGFSDKSKLPPDHLLSSRAVRELVYSFFDSLLPKFHPHFYLPARELATIKVPDFRHANYLLGMIHLFGSRRYAPIFPELEDAANHVYPADNLPVYLKPIIIDPELKSVCNSTFIDNTPIAGASFRAQTLFFNTAPAKVIFHSVKAAYLGLLTFHEDISVREKGALLMLMQIRQATEDLICLGYPSFNVRLQENHDLFDIDLRYRLNLVGGFNSEIQKAIREHGYSYFCDLATL